MRLCVVAALAVVTVQAGGWPGGKRPFHVTEALRNRNKYAHQTGIGATFDGDLPSDFTWCMNDGVNYCLPSWNQHQPHYCGGCWVHGSLAAAQDRINIQHIKKGWSGAPVLLARQDMFTCAREYGFGAGCNGGSPEDVYEYMARFGLPDETCNNFMAANGKCNPLGRCQNCMPNGEDLSNYTCWPVKDYVTYYVSEYGNIRGERRIMEEVLARGPVVCNMATPENFVYAYHSGVFRDVTASDDVDNDVELVGWGEEENGDKYWIIRNSWGSYWGEGGFFRIGRGDDTLKLESVGCTFPIVDLSDEERVLSGKMVGSMYGIVPKEDAAQYSMPFHDYPKAWLQQMTTPELPEFEKLASHPPPVVRHEAPPSKGFEVNEAVKEPVVPEAAYQANVLEPKRLEAVSSSSGAGVFLIVSVVCMVVLGVLAGRYRKRDYISF